jgi:hypothetical protein
MYSDFTANTTMYMLRRGPWKYVAYLGFGPQLFNLQRDPEEIENLAQTDPDNAHRMDEALRQIVDYQAVHRQVVAYDKASFRAWREQALAGPVQFIDPSQHPLRNPDNTVKLFTYDEVMARVYQGWGPAQEKIIKH